MKKRGLIAALVVVMVMMSSAFCFATDSNFALKSSYPKDGQKNTSIENVGVKLQFTQSVSSKEAMEHNRECVKIVDEDGKELPIKVLTDADEDGLMLVLGDNTDEDYPTIKSNSEYKLVISGDLMDDNGDTLGKDQTITFQTFNQKMNSIINMVLMFAMFGGMMFFMVRDQAKQQQEKNSKNSKAEAAKANAAFNPYREAKKTGKTVEEVVEIEKKRLEKEAKKNKKKGIVPEDNSPLILSEILPYVYHVSEPRPISAAGITYKRKKASEPEVKVEAPARKRNVKRGRGRRK